MKRGKSFQLQNGNSEGSFDILIEICLCNINELNPKTTDPAIKNIATEKLSI